MYTSTKGHVYISTCMHAHTHILTLPTHLHGCMITNSHTCMRACMYYLMFCSATLQYMRIHKYLHTCTGQIVRPRKPMFPCYKPLGIIITVQNSWATKRIFATVFSKKSWHTHTHKRTCCETQTCLPCGRASSYSSCFTQLEQTLTNLARMGRNGFLERFRFSQGKTQNRQRTAQTQSPA